MRMEEEKGMSGQGKDAVLSLIFFSNATNYPECIPFFTGNAQTLQVPHPKEGFATSRANLSEQSFS